MTNPFVWSCFSLCLHLLFRLLGCLYDIESNYLGQ
uniref:Uncharacterized protein n=1 Tax=Arundo donax TaxID=35708 RepID=A0A0A9BML0_ARUDO